MISEKEAEAIKSKLLEQIGNLPKEQIGNLKNEIIEMNEEELEEFIKEQSNPKSSCFFCEIAKGKVETYKIYESQNILAILDINPAAKGHVLVIPKQHFTFNFQIPSQTSAELFFFIKTISKSLIGVTKAIGLTTYINEGLSGNIPHFFINLLPRFKEDKLEFMTERFKANKEELEKIAHSLRNELNHEISEVNNQKQAAEKKEVAGEKSDKNNTFKIRRMRIPS